MDAIQNFFSSIGDTLEPLFATLKHALLAGFPFINVFVILVAGMFGANLYEKPDAQTKHLMLKLLGVAVVLFGINEAWQSLFVLQEGVLETKGTLLVVVSVLLGWLFGEALMLDRLLAKLGILLSRFFAPKPTPMELAQLKKSKPTPEELSAESKKLCDCAEGFVIATVLCGFSSTLFTGFLEGRASGEAAPLLIKLAFDLVLVFTLAVIYGNGASLSCIPVLCTELFLWLADAKWSEILTEDLLRQTALVGSIILLSGGVCLMYGKRFRAANLLPALILPCAFTLAVGKITETVEEKVNKK